MGLSDEDYFNLDNLPKRKIMEHLYRVQRISTKFYEFRQVYDADIYDTSFPNYIRVLNFGRRKTGWLTYNPKKVFVDNLGNIQKIKEIWTHKQVGLLASIFSRKRSDYPLHPSLQHVGLKARTPRLHNHLQPRL